MTKRSRVPMRTINRATLTRSLELFSAQATAFLLLSVTLLLLSTTPSLSAPHERPRGKDARQALRQRVQDAHTRKLHGRAPAEARYAKGQLIVKYKDSVTECVHCLLKTHKSFRFATPDASDSLDRLHAKYQVQAAHALFRTESEEAKISGPKTLAALRQQQANKLQASQRRFAKRTARAPYHATPPDLSHVYVLDLPQDVDIESAVAEFAQDPHVAYAQPNYLIQAQLPNDTYVDPDQNGTWSTGAWGQSYEDLWGLKKIQADQAWAVTQGQGIVVGVVDTGVDYNHPDLAANIWTNPGEIPNNGLDDDGNGYVDDTRGWDFTTCSSINSYGDCVTFKSPDNDPMDEHGHGTHVAGVIAAVGNNSIGTIGVAPQAKIMPVRGLLPKSTSAETTLVDQNGPVATSVVSALLYAAENGADVINNSWRCLYPCLSNPVAEDAVRTAYALGAVVVFASGNYYDIFSSLADYSPQNMTDPKPIVVAPTTETDTQLFQYSVVKFGNLLDVSAPGGGAYQSTTVLYHPEKNVLSLKLQNCANTAFCDPNLIVGTNYLRQSGSSLAAAYASGTAALILAHHPSFTHDEVRQILRVTADDLNPAGFDIWYGAGRINAARAVMVNSVPRVQITSPASGSTFTLPLASIAIEGTATWQGSAQYALSYGIGSAPTQWFPIGSPSSTQVNDGVLGVWDTSQTTITGPYTLRLAVTTADGVPFEHAVQVTLEPPPVTVQITTPASGSVFTVPGSPITIEGTATWSVPSQYALSYGIGRTPRTWIPIGAPSSTPVDNGILGVWDTSQLSAERYTLRLVVTNQYGSKETRAQVAFESPGIVRISSDDARPGIVAIDGNRVVWTDSRSGASGLYLCEYDPATATCPERRLTNALANPADVAISGNHVVWEDWRSDDAEIYHCLYDPMTGTCPEQHLTTNPLDRFGDPSYQYAPDVSGNVVVWEDDRDVNWDDPDNENYNIYSYDLTTGKENQITSEIDSQVQPAISGNWIVWEDWRLVNWDADVWNVEIYGRNLATGGTRNLSSAEDEQHTPLISGNSVIWYDWLDAALHLYDLTSRTNWPITGERASPDPYTISGNRIVWQDSRNGDGDIYFCEYDPATHACPEQAIALQSASQDSPAISGKRMVWVDYRTGKPQLYLYDLNQPPVLAAIGSKTVNEGQTLTFTISASDPNGDPVTYSAGPLPTGASFTASTRTFSWTPGYDQGTGEGMAYSVTFTATDPEGRSASETVMITVFDVPILNVLSISDSPDPFSPNGDGNNDTTTISATFNHPITSGKLLIGTSASVLVRRFDFGGLNTTILSQSWDGKDANGLVVPDGTYTYTFIGFDATGSVKGSGTVTVNTVVVSAAPNPFSPNADGRKDTTLLGASFNHTITSGKLHIANSAGTIVRSFSLSGSTTSVSQSWDGKDNNGLTVPDGPYTYTFIGYDATGYTKGSGTVTAETVAPTISGLSDAPDPFKPRTGQTATISFSLSEPSYVTLQIYNGVGTLIRTLFSNNFSSSTSNAVVWDGKNNSGVVVPNGTYTYKLWVEDPAGNRPSIYPATDTIRVQ